MSVENILITNYESAENLSAKKGYVVKANTLGKAALSSITSAPLGIVEDGGTAAGQSVTINIGPVVRALAGGTIIPGDKVRSNSLGKAVAYTSGAAWTIGTSIDNATKQSGDYVNIIRDAQYYAS